MGVGRWHRVLWFWSVHHHLVLPKLCRLLGSWHYFHHHHTRTVLLHARVLFMLFVREIDIIYFGINCVHYNILIVKVLLYSVLHRICRGLIINLFQLNLMLFFFHLITFILTEWSFIFLCLFRLGLCSCLVFICMFWRFRGTKIRQNFLRQITLSRCKDLRVFQDWLCLYLRSQFLKCWEIFTLWRDCQRKFYCFHLSALSLFSCWLCNWLQGL